MTSEDAARVEVALRDALTRNGLGWLVSQHVASLNRPHDDEVEEPGPVEARERLALLLDAAVFTLRSGVALSREIDRELRLAGDYRGVWLVDPGPQDQAVLRDPAPVGGLRVDVVPDVGDLLEALERLRGMVYD